ncbi:MAG TPA: ZIP family metal transporter [Candidatus Methanoperedenaceae archaeon]|nr:ZIP family metal transporter [Candidatus Methanoperedenaceae archaeon]
MISILLALFAGLSDLLSGLVPLYYKMEESRTRYIIAFAAGTMLGAIFFEMLPEIHQSDSVFIALGFFSFYLLERLTMIHACGEYECTTEAHRIGWLPVLGMASDNIIDGVGIAVAYLINPITGIIVALSVIVHEIPQGLSTTILLSRSGKGKLTILSALAAESILYPVGAALAFLVPGSLNTAVLAFVTGDFLYISASDLLPDAHKRFNIKVIFAVLLGAISVLVLEFLVKR